MPKFKYGPLLQKDSTSLVNSQKMLSQFCRILINYFFRTRFYFNILQSLDFNFSFRMESFRCEFNCWGNAMMAHELWYWDRYFLSMYNKAQISWAYILFFLLSSLKKLYRMGPPVSVQSVRTGSGVNFRKKNY
jgi:hypothetical protein